jgi:hypothetical protein
MTTIYDTRRARLEALIAEHGGSIRALAEAASMNEAYLSQIRTQQPDSRTGRRRQMGDKLARSLETRCKKPAGWMDQPAGGFTPEAAAIAAMFDRLPPDRRREYATVIRTMLGPAVSDDQVEERMPITRRENSDQ